MLQAGQAVMPTRGVACVPAKTCRGRRPVPSRPCGSGREKYTVRWRGSGVQVSSAHEYLTLRLLHLPFLAPDATTRTFRPAVPLRTLGRRFIL
jgi:hypothetical protein